METLPFNQPAYSEYMDDMNYSQGFYVTKPKDGWVMMGATKRVEDSDDDRYHKAVRAAKFAVEEHNKTAGEAGFLRFLKIVNLNVEPSAGTIYYITASMKDAAGEDCLYQLQIWETLKARYKLNIFRPAPYCVKFPERRELADCCVLINDLMPWMDENYLYYKCFLASPAIRGVEVIRDGGRYGANIWLRDSAQIEKIVNKYQGRKMPHSDISYTFVL